MKLSYRRACVWGLVLAAAGISAWGQESAPAPDSKSKPAEPALQIMTLDGESVGGSDLRLADGALTFKSEQGERKLPLRDVWRIRQAVPADMWAQRGQSVLVLADGPDRALLVSGVSVEAGKLTAGSTLLGQFKLDLPWAAALYLPGRTQTAEALRKRFTTEVKLPKVNVDFLVTEEKGALNPLPGALKELKGDAVRFSVEQEERVVPITDVRVLQLSSMTRTTSAPAGVLVGKDGSSAFFTSLKLEGDKLSMEGNGLSAPAASLANVAEIRFQSDRLVYLPDLTPSKVEQAGMFDVSFPFRKDRAVNGGPLRLNKENFPRGLGVHSRCSLTYELKGEYASFATLVGIDESSGTRGNATVRVLGDGKDLVEPVKVAGGEKAKPVRCDLAGVKQLTLLADFGDDNTDVGDAVDFADARLIKK